MERYYWAALQIVPGINTSRIKSLVSYFGSARQAWQALRRDLFVCGILEDRVCNNLILQRESIDINKMAADWEQKGIKIVILVDKDYPNALSNIFSPPPVLYYRGKLPNKRKLIAIVGARKCSAYGRGAAKMLAGDLAAAGIGVVSGAARGIDTAAHQGALESGGYTIAVLGCGVDVAYPSENAGLLNIIAECGAVISEYAPGTAPLAKFFPVRNRIISGLASGVVVVEAAPKSGSLITADFALEEGREVFAVPGNIFSESSKGTNHLIKMGAKPVESAADILEDFGLKRAETSRPPVSLSEDEAVVFGALLLDKPVGVDEIVVKTKLSPQVVTYILLRMELKGLVEQYSGQRYCRIPGRESVE